MSYCELLGFTDQGNMLHIKEFRNAHGWASYIWSKLHEKYLEGGSWMADPQGVWRLVENDELSDEEKITLWSTFDHSLVRLTEILPLINAYKTFLRMYPPVDRVCHLQDMIRELKELIEEPGNIIAVGWYGMSVGDNPWTTYDEDIDEYVNYDITTGDKHEFLTALLLELAPKLEFRVGTAFESLYTEDDLKADIDKFLEPIIKLATNAEQERQFKATKNIMFESLKDSPHSMKILRETLQEQEAE